MHSMTALPINGHDNLIQHGTHFHTESDMDENSGYVLLYLIILLIITQFMLVYWKKYYNKSWNIVSLILLWLIPIIWSTSLQFYLMIVIWSLFTLSTLYVFHLARQRPLNKHTPRLIYSWFFFSFVICYWMSVIGYGMVMCDILGITSLLPESINSFVSIGISLIWYGVYFGTLVCDCASLASTLLTVGMGYGGKELLPQKSIQSNQCAICDQPFTAASTSDTKSEQIIQLQCHHTYHEFCLQGFLLVAKQDYCVQCNEKVSTKQIFTTQSPWLIQKKGWSAALDYTRVLVVYIPTFTFLAKYIIEFVY